MARRKKKSVRRARTRTRSAFRKKTYRKKSGNPLMKTALGAVAYGFGRQYVSGYVSQLASRVGLPNVFGEMTDEVGMLAVSWALAKGKIPLVNKVGFIRDAGKAGIAIESAIIGRQLAARANFGGMASTGTTTVTNTQTVF